MSQEQPRSHQWKQAEYQRRRSVYDERAGVPGGSAKHLSQLRKGRVCLSPPLARARKVL